ncbi:hypothetical protein EJ06DRAFT_529310 [Trichodelitschia bisporula]|uniref:Uncharacterized protein n=1 Tax=Trichodelitschia bisporula TaxID=703511 RepID=A0A6G1HZJ6_9PEZI|nr:hypothetical protein EJ06DRAFT_529310 [Trichodelitschia bisporula]
MLVCAGMLANVFILAVLDSWMSENPGFELMLSLAPYRSQVPSGIKRLTPRRMGPSTASTLQPLGPLSFSSNVRGRAWRSSISSKCTGNAWAVPKPGHPKLKQTTCGCVCTCVLRSQ